MRVPIWVCRWVQTTESQPIYRRLTRLRRRLVAPDQMSVDVLLLLDANRFDFSDCPNDFSDYPMIFLHPPKYRLDSFRVRPR